MALNDLYGNQHLTDAELKEAIKKASDELGAASGAMFEMKHTPVPLHDELWFWETDHGFRMVCGPPWIHSMYMGEVENRRLNAQYEYKMLLFEEARREDKFPRMFAWCERPYRAELLYEVMHEMDPAEYWETLGWVWTDSENCYQNLDLFEQMFTADLPAKECLMDPAEHEALEKLPDLIPIWHGVDGSEFAWSTNKKVAEWFAYRFPEADKVPRLRSGYAPKEKVLAHFLGRGEEEILILPENVLDMKEEELPPDRKLRHPGLEKEESSEVESDMEKGAV